MRSVRLGVVVSQIRREDGNEKEEHERNDKSKRREECVELIFWREESRQVRTATALACSKIGELGMLTR